MKYITREDVKNVLQTIVGCAIMAAGFSFFTYPNSIVSGGITGVSQILNLLTGLPVGVMVIIMNIPLFAVAWKKFGLRFIIYSLIGMVGSSVFIDLFDMLHLTLTNDTLLAAVYGGLVKGLGFGLIYSTGGTSGGSDIAVRLLRRKYSYVNFGTLSLLVDAVVVAAFAVIFKKFDSAMYTIIMMFVSSRVVNLILYGHSNSSVCYIVSIQPKVHVIANEIGRQLGRGATILRGEGAYSGEDRYVILCAVKRQQIATLKKIVLAEDEHAFVIVTESHEVFGKNFLNIAKVD